MPGATSLGIHYPLQNETVDAASWQTMANDIDALLTSLDALRDVAVSRPAAKISGGSTIVAANTDSVMSGFSTESFDTGGYANLGVNNDRLTLPTGIFWCYTVANMSGATTLAMTRTGLLVGGTTIWAMQQQDNYTAGHNPSSIRSSGLVVITVASTILQARIRWAGTGGPATFLSQELAAYKVRDLADV